MSSGPVLRRAFPFPSALAAQCETCSKMTGPPPPLPTIFQPLFWLVREGWAYLLFWGNARCASQGRVKGLWWSLDGDAHRVTSNRTQPTAWRGSLWGWSLPVGHAWGLKTCSHAIVQCPGRTSMIMCSICKMFILWRDLKQTELIFTESCSQKNWPFFSQALLFPHSSSILLSKMLTRKLRMEPWGHSVFCRNYIQQQFWTIFSFFRSHFSQKLSRICTIVDSASNIPSLLET